MVANNLGNVINLQFGDEISRPFIVISNLGDGLWHRLYHLSGSWNLSDFESEKARSPAVSTPQPRSKVRHNWPLPTGKIALETSIEPLKGIALDDDGPWFIWVCLKMVSTPFYPMVLLIIIPFLNGYFIGNIPYFQTNPYVHFQKNCLWKATSGRPIPWSQPPLRRYQRHPSPQRSGRCNTTGCAKMGIAQPPWVKKGQDGSCQTVKPGNMCVCVCVLSQAQSWVNDPGWQVPRSNSFIHESPTTELATWKNTETSTKKSFDPIQKTW